MQFREICENSDKKMREMVQKNEQIVDQEDEEKQNTGVVEESSSNLNVDDTKWVMVDVSY